MNEAILYFAYGSNLHPIRLMQRVNDVDYVGLGELRKHALRFHKESTDGSAKCNAFSTNSNSDVVLGVLYRFPAQRLQNLDDAEGRGYGYDRYELPVFCSGSVHQPVVYIAQPSYIRDSLEPYDWYKNLVIAGAEYHSFPPHYVEKIRTISSTPDPKPEREQENQKLLRKIGFETGSRFVYHAHLENKK